MKTRYTVHLETPEETPQYRGEVWSGRRFQTLRRKIRETRAQNQGLEVFATYRRGSKTGFVE